MLSAIVLTKNCQKIIRKCLNSIKFADEIIVIDDYSKDKTLRIAKKFNAKIFKRKLNNDFASQRKFGLSKAKGNWILFLDSDERVSRELALEINWQLANPRPELGSKAGNWQHFDGFYIKRKDKFLGKWLKFGETANVNFLRLAKSGKGKWQGKVHETWQVKGKIGELKNPILHDRSLSISNFLKRIDFYSTLRARELKQQGAQEDFWKIFIYPLAKFFQNYFVRLGVLDGLPGLVMTTLMSWHSLLVRLKLRRISRNA